MIGSTIGSYRITGQLGEGGMGTVYRATDNIEREVAIKALHSQLTKDASRLQRFRAEAVALGRLHHPNIASLYHLLEQDGNYYMVMEFVEGQTLEDIVRNKGAMPPQMALFVFGDALKGFEHAHTRGVIHRDIKPSNIMVSGEGVTKITDFGIARMAGSGRMTQTGKVIGTLEYMSPEQVRGLEQDARSDIYSLGILLFELLTGRMPFTATSDYEIMRAHLEVAPPPARSLVATLPAGIDAIISRALAKDPAARFQTVGEMHQAIETVARELPAPAPAQTVLARPETFRTREATPAPPVPATNQAQISGQPVSGPYAPPNNFPPPRSVPSPTPMPKWAIPAIVGVLAVVLLGGGLAMSRRGGGQTPTPGPTPTVTQQSKIGNTTAGSDPFSDPGSMEATNNVNNIAAESLTLSNTPTPKPTTELTVPDSIPGFSEPLEPVKPTAVPPTPRPQPQPTPRRVVSDPPRPRVRERVADRPRPRKRARVVERPRTPVRPRVADKPRTRPRVVSQPTKKRSRPRSDEARLDSIMN